MVARPARRFQPDSDTSLAHARLLAEGLRRPGSSLPFPATAATRSRV